MFYCQGFSYFGHNATIIRAVANGPVEPDKSGLWMELFSLDPVILIVVNGSFQIHIS